MPVQEARVFPFAFPPVGKLRCFRRIILYYFIMAAGEFRWNEHNIEHAQKHGCTIDEIQAAAGRPNHGFPRKIGNGKYQVVGRGVGGRVIEVIFIRDADGTMYVIHAQQVSTRRRRRR